ncbi:MAG: tetratricopeptide repeat protein [Alphaproteobacteria bacterium]|nr:tetratricopeptide repeat protein [Alphaproteobacteria bacterium]
MLQLSLGKYLPCCVFLERKGKKDLSLLLLAHFSPQQALENLQIYIKNDYRNEVVLAALAELYFLKSDFSKLSLALQKISDKDQFAQAKKLYFEAILALQDGDMMTASENLLSAVKLFKKQRAYLEEAKAFQMLGVTYRASGLFDVSQFMFETARKIYESLSYYYGIIDALGNLGMLMSLQNRFEEAQDYFDKALQQNACEAYNAYLYNHKSLLYFFQRDFTKCESLLEEALMINREYHDEVGLAFSLELMAYLKKEQKRPQDSLLFAEEAEQIHQKYNNFSALLESKYVQATAFYELELFDRAEEISRELLQKTSQKQSSFHIANVYNLLGLIYIKKKDFRRAKSLFQQSLSLEQKNDRNKAVASDYYNIALADLMAGYKEQAVESLKKSLEIALANDDNDLVNATQEKLNMINQKE